MATKTVPIEPLGEVFHGMPAPNSKEPARHTVTVQLPGWNMVLEFIKKDPAFFAKFVDCKLSNPDVAQYHSDSHGCAVYPRFVPHRDIKQVCEYLCR